MQAELFLLHTQAVVTPAAEIEEVRWVGAVLDPEMILAPLTRDLILPLYRSRLNAPR
ncbi:hypothetical protein D3C80_1913740 [compost metagenome]